MEIPPTIPPPKPDYDDVAAWGLSLRGIITFMLLATCCGIWIANLFLVVKFPVPDALLVFTGTAFGFYFRK